ncbi:hypothetical protein C5D36_14470 [Rathayibacter sp. AY1C6]|uniref:hypothetical protein n=1 Tax=Rathayibacter sp. AY1C6 TaxID=2080539 RepID=UPI000CE7A587|nr:hypothetical protein [Rathayibacter sp. AY1C6]PPG12884.1 hypothetical protein C5D36_14470 [Rathayibacter sp. AY1C6]
MIIWPRLSRAIAAGEWDRVKNDGSASGRQLIRDAHWRAIGNRADEQEFETLRERVTALAESHGFPDSAGDDLGRFDREAAFVVRELIDVPFAEAATGDVWSFVSFAVLPDVTEWRFGHRNKERWIGSDLTRHTWARLWWQGEAFRQEPELLGPLSESDLNQLFERRSIGGDSALVRALARSFVTVTGDRRAIVRDATKRIRRLLAFVQTPALDEDEIRALADEVVEQSTLQVTGGLNASHDTGSTIGASVSVVPEEQVPERALGLVEPEYIAYVRPAALSATQLLEESALEGVVEAAIAAEGPVLQSRLRRLIAGTVEDESILGSADAAMNGAIASLLDSRRIEADDFEIPLLGSQRTLRIAGTPALRIRPLGVRRLLEVPLQEVLAVSRLAPMQTAAGRMEHMVDFYGLVDIDVLDRMILQQLAAHGADDSDRGS